MLSQGNQGEVLAIAWLMSCGWKLAIPVGNCPDYDVVADMGGTLARVQVKTTRVYRGDRWEVTLCTRGGNQSWNGLVKTFGPHRCDYLYVHTASGRRWFMPATRVDGGSAILLGGPKYAEYEVDPGPPLTLS